MSLIYGLVSGILFGVLLQRAEVLRYDRRVGALRLLDMTIFKFMLTAIMVAAVGIYALKDMGVVSLSLKATIIGLGDMGKITLPELLGVSHWVVIPILILVFLGAFRLFEQKVL